MLFVEGSTIKKLLLGDISNYNNSKSISDSFFETLNLA